MYWLWKARRFKCLKCLKFKVPKVKELRVILKKTGFIKVSKINQAGKLATESQGFRPLTLPVTIEPVKLFLEPIRPEFLVYGIACIQCLKRTRARNRFNPLH